MSLKAPKNIDVLIASSFYLSAGLADCYAFALDTRMAHMAILAFLCIVASIGMFPLKRWGLYLAGALILPQGCVPVAPLFASLRSYGLQAFSSTLILWMALHIFVSLLIVRMLLTSKERFR